MDAVGAYFLPNPRQEKPTTRWQTQHVAISETQIPAPHRWSEDSVTSKDQTWTSCQTVSKSLCTCYIYVALSAACPNKQYCSCKFAWLPSQSSQAVARDACKPMNQSWRCSVSELDEQTSHNNWLEYSYHYGHSLELKKDVTWIMILNLGWSGGRHESSMFQEQGIM